MAETLLSAGPPWRVEQRPLTSRLETGERGNARFLVKRWVFRISPRPRHRGKRPSRACLPANAPNGSRVGKGHGPLTRSGAGVPTRGLALEHGYSGKNHQEEICTRGSSACCSSAVFWRNIWINVAIPPLIYGFSPRGKLTKMRRSRDQRRNS